MFIPAIVAIFVFAWQFENEFEWAYSIVGASAIIIQAAVIYTQRGSFKR